MSKANTVLQLSTVSLALASAAYGSVEAVGPLIPWLHYATAATTAATLVDYIRRPGIATSSPRTPKR